MPRNGRRVCCCDVPVLVVDGPRHPSHTRPSNRTPIAHIVSRVAVGPKTACCAPAADTRGRVSIHRVRAVERDLRRCTMALYHGLVPGQVFDNFDFVTCRSVFVCGSPRKRIIRLMPHDATDIYCLILCSCYVPGSKPVLSVAVSSGKFAPWVLDTPYAGYSCKLRFDPIAVR